MRAGTFVADMKEIRRKAREHLTEGAVTQNYKGRVDESIAILNQAVATEIVCILRYKFHAVCAAGLASEAVKEEFAQHATEEEQHLVDMIKEDLVAERIAIETYRDMVRHFGDNDPTTRVILERILAQEEEHANDMHDLLVAHEGRPMLEGNDASKKMKRFRRIA